MKKLFGTDGIRGIANKEPITAEVAFHIGRTGAYLFKDEANSGILIGKDTRISGDMLEAALIAGICSAGVDVLKVGIVPTPVVAYLTKVYHANCGIVISASHNPYDHNGIKYIRGDGFKFSDLEEEEIERIYFENHSKNEWPTKKNIGRVKELNGAMEKYVDYIKNDIDELQIITKRVLDIYINIIEKNKIRSLELTNNFKLTLADEHTKSGKLTEESINLGKEVHALNLDNKNLKETVKEYKNLLIKEKDDLKEYKELNILLKEKNKELMECKNTSEKLELLNQGLKEELTLSIKEAEGYSNQIERAREDKILGERQLSETKSFYESKLREQEIDHNKKSSLIKQELNLLQQQKLLQKEEEYREKIWILKSQFDDKIATLISDKENLLLKISANNLNNTNK